MSIGLGKVEKLILKALKRWGDMTIDDLCQIRIFGMDFFTEKRLEEIGTYTVANWSSATWQSTTRAVRSLVSKGLVKCIKTVNDREHGTRHEFTKVATC